MIDDHVNVLPPTDQAQDAVSSHERLNSSSGAMYMAGRRRARAVDYARALSVRLVASRVTFFSLSVGVVIWELLARWAELRFLPPFSRVLLTATDMIASGEIVTPLVASILSLLVGYGMAVAFGLALGVLMGRYRMVEYVLAPYLNALLATPKIVLVPVLFALFGLSRLIQVAVVFLSAFFVIALNTSVGIRNVEPAYVEMARAFGAQDRQLLRKVLLPGALPLTMAGLRLGMMNAVKGMVTGEMFIALFGLGALLRKYGGRFDAEKVFAIVLVLICVALLCSFAVQAIERRLTRWMNPNE